MVFRKSIIIYPHKLNRYGGRVFPVPPFFIVRRRNDNRPPHGIRRNIAAAYEIKTGDNAKSSVKIMRNFQRRYGIISARRILYLRFKSFFSSLSGQPLRCGFAEFAACAAKKFKSVFRTDMRRTKNTSHRVSVRMK